MESRKIVINKGKIVSYTVIKGNLWLSGDDECLLDEVSRWKDGEYIVNWVRDKNEGDGLINCKIRRVR